MKKMTLPIIVEKDEDGYFVSCQALQGCYTQAGTYEEALENIRDAIRLYLEDMIENGEEVPEPHNFSLTTLEITL